MSRRFFLLLLAVAVIGCGEGGRPVVPVRGTVTRNGQPVPNLFLNFMPEGGRPSWGQSNERGEFTLDYDPQRKGAEVGTHKVYVQFRASSPKEEMEFLSGKRKYHSDQKAIEAKYGKLETTPLTVEVKSGGGPIAIVVD